MSPVSNRHALPLSRHSVRGRENFLRPDEIWYSSEEEKEQLFPRTVIDMLQNGGKWHTKLDATRIEDDHIRAYLIRPKKVFRQNMYPTEEDYTKQWDQIRATVGDLVPTLKDQSRWKDITHNVVDDKEELDNEDTFRGQSLFKYDRLQDIGGGQTQRWAMLWIEGEQVAYHADKW